MSASISVTVGPVVTVLVVPGTFATLHPYVMAQASLFGTMKFEKASASEVPEGITPVSWPVSSEVCTDEAQKQSLASRQFVQQRPGKETTSSGNATSGQGAKPKPWTLNPKIPMREATKPKPSTLNKGLNLQP